jgi:hypothetical protein
VLGDYRRIRYSAGPGLTFWWLRATKYGLVDHRLTPLFGMEIGSVARTRDVVGGGFEATSLEVVFFTDLATGERVDAIVNPYTGETLARPDSLIGPTTVDYTPDGPRYPAALPGVRFTMQPAIGLFAIEGDDVWLRDDNSTTATAEAGGAPLFVLNDWSTYHCSRGALEDAGLASVPATVAFNAESGWLPWMNMGNRPGAMLSRGSGRKLPDLEAMPERYRRLLRERYPEVARDPAAALERPPATFAP